MNNLNYERCELVSTEPLLAKEKPLFFDTETDGFYGTIELAQLYQESWNVPLLIRKPDPHQLAEVLQQYTLVMHSGNYDISTIQRQTKSRWIPDKFEDTLLLSRLKWYDQHEYTLDAVLRYALGFDPYLEANLDKKTLQKSKWNKSLTADQFLYASIDVLHLPAVYNACKEFQEDTNYKLDMKTMRYCFDMQNNGMPVEEAKRAGLHALNEIKREAIDCPINSKSYVQVRPYIGENISDDLALSLFTSQGNTKAEQVNRDRKLRTQNSYLTKFKTNDQRIYGLFAPTARNGRLRSREQNLQQIPRDTKVVFGFPKDGNKVLIYADFSQLELRMLCAKIGERKLESLFRSNTDLHTYTKDRVEAIRLADLPEKDKRQVGKTANFNLAYGGGAKMLQGIILKETGIYISEEDCLEIKKGWLKLFPGINRWQQNGIKVWRMIKEGSKDRDIIPRTTLDRKYVGKLMTDHLNIEISGSGADVAKIAFCRVMKYLQNSNEVQSEQVNMLNFVHDSYILECPNVPQVYEKVAQVVGESMKSAWEDVSQFCVIKDLPNPVTVYVGYNWGDIEYKNEFIYKLEL